MAPVSSPPAVLGTDRDPFFLAFWERYPRRSGKGQARTAWSRARRRGIPPEVMIRGAEAYRDDPNREAAYTKLPATWLNGECWDDPPLPDRAPQGAAGTTMASFRRVLANVGPDGNLPVAAVGAAAAAGLPAATRAAIDAEAAIAASGDTTDEVAAAWRSVTREH